MAPTETSPTPSSTVPLLILTPLAVLALPTYDAVVAGSVGAITGLFIGMAAPFPGSTWAVKLVCEVVGLFALAASLVGYFAGNTYGGTGLVLRITFPLLLVACFGLGVVLSHLAGRFSLGYALTLFGFLQVALYFASPGGADLAGLDGARFLTYLGVACAVALGLGMVDPDVALLVTGYGVAVLTLGLAGLGLDSGVSIGESGAAVVAVASSCVVGAIVWRSMRALLR